MSLKLRNRGRTVYLLLTAWVLALGLCGHGALFPVSVELPHHASPSTNIACEQACLNTNEARQSAVIGQPSVMSLHSDLQPGVLAAYTFSFDAEGFSPPTDPSIHHPASIKRYQLISTYRI